MTQRIGFSFGFVGGGGGGGGSSSNPFQKTYAEMVALAGAGGFTQFAFYWITDRYILVQAMSNGILSDGAVYVDMLLGTPEADDIIYDFANDWIEERRDKRGNVVSCSYSYYVNYLYGLLNPFLLFRWGDDNVTGNTVKNSAVIMNDVYGMYGVQFGGVFSDNVVVNGCYLDLLWFTGSSIQFLECIFENSSTVYSGNYGDRMSVSKLFQFLRFSNSSTLDVSFDSYLDLRNSTFQDQSAIYIYGGDIASASYLSNISASAGTVSIYGSFASSVSSVTMSGSSTLVVVSTTTICTVQNVTAIAYSTVNISNSTVMNASANASSVVSVASCGYVSDVACNESSSLTLASVAAIASGLYVYGDSSVSVNVSSNTISNWRVSEASAVALSNNTKNKISFICSRRSVTLDPNQAHSNLSLTQFGSNLTQFIDYIAGGRIGPSNHIMVTAGTQDAYTGIFWFYNCSTNANAPSIVHGFSSSVFVNNSEISIQVDGNYAVFGNQYLLVRTSFPPVSQQIAGPSPTLLYGRSVQSGGDAVFGRFLSAYTLFEIDYASSIR